MQSSSRDHPALVAAARHALPGVPGHPAPVALDGCDVEPVRAFCRDDRISGLLAAAMQCGEISVVEDDDHDVDEHATAIRADWHEALHACVLLEALLVRLADRLDADGLRWMATKGPTVGHLDFGDPALRTFADVDVIIHPDDWERTVWLLADPSLTRPWHQRYVQRYGKGLTVTVDDMEVDLHLRFAIGRFGARCRTRELFGRVGEIELAGRTIPAPATSDRLLHACFHAALGGHRELRAFRDVAQIALATPDAVDETWETARRWDVEAVVAAAVTEAWRRLDLPAGHELVERAERIPVSRADRRALDVFAERPGFRAQAGTTIAALHWRERPRFVHTSWMMSRERGR